MRPFCLNNAASKPLLAGLATLCLAISAVQADTRPNVLVILVDDAGYNDFGFMGSPDIPTPNLDRLASMGTIFTDAHVTATVCSPSRAGLMTGRYQQRFGHECNVPPDDTGMDPAESTMADVLGAAGYRSICIGKWHLGNRTMYHPNNRGFDDFWGFLEGGRSYFPDTRADQPENYRAILHNRTQVDFEGYLTDVFTDKAIEYMDSTVDQPWFIYLSYNAVHTPMEAKEADLERFANHPRQKLAAMTWSLDENVGKIMTFLESKELMEDTLIFFLSDNGGAGMHNNQSRNDPLKGWKGNKFEGGHRVPFLVSWKGTIPSGQRFDLLSSSLDVLATCLAVSGLEETPGKPLDGVNLLPYLLGEEERPPHEMLFWRKDRMAAARHGSFKLIRLEGFGYRLYDLGTDLGESVDLRESHPLEFELMKKSLIAWDREQVVPLWLEGEDWSSVTYEIHRALMDNEQPRYLNPDQKMDWKSKAP
ncbi:sulfatase-like hydrolase/transferase [Puniceicoccales bacterium CK1056]|uniref:Sulfatase-like hydrolase/transferase n=1 Tax=Oceanipulchritudo coccoides TaxID=2706888 RepID=A0A6B2LY09_9BACT|nr:sulfatase-like hydrolase/transferase [Oceanipulchritudo coccoides]NDV61491.1 sulfatase-like hydrolase/transferase [Oceanipulchritudo coccoides]